MDDFGMGYALGSESGDGNRNDGMWGGDGWWAIILFAMIFGWGNGGFGGFGNRGGSSPAVEGIATRSDIMDGFALNDLQRGVSAISQGICDSTYALNNSITSGFNGTNMALCQGFNGVERSFNTLGYEMQDCCCQTQRAIDGVNYNMATNFCAVQNSANNNARDIIQSTHNDTDRVIAKLNEMEATRQQEKIQALQSENQSLKFAASQATQNSYIAATMDAQTAELVRRCCPTPVPAYTVPAPYPYAANGCCGCNC